MSRIDDVGDALKTSIEGATATAAFTVKKTDEAKDYLQEPVAGEWKIYLVTKAMRETRIGRGLFEYEYDINVTVVGKLKAAEIDAGTLDGKTLADEIADHLKTAGRIDGAAYESRTVDLLFSQEQLRDGKFVNVSTYTFRETRDH